MLRALSDALLLLTLESGATVEAWGECHAAGELRREEGWARVFLSAEGT